MLREWCRMCPLEFGSVRPYVKLDADRRVVRGRLVILVQPSAYFPGLHPNDRIVPGCIPGRALKEIDSDGAFFPPLVVPFKPVMDYIGQKLFAALAWLKNRTVQDRVQFTKD